MSDGNLSDELGDNDELDFGATMDDATGPSNTAAAVRGTAGAPQNTLRNDQHDAAMEVDDGEEIATGRGGAQQNAPGRAVASSSAAAAGGGLAPSGSTVLKNSDHDAAFDVEDDIPDEPAPAAGSAAAAAAGGASVTGELRNNPNDLAFDAGSEASNSPGHSPLNVGGAGGRTGASAIPALGGGTRPLENNPHDMAVDLSSSGSPSSSVQNSVERPTAGGAGAMSGTDHKAGLAAWGAGGGGGGGAASSGTNMAAGAAAWGGGGGGGGTKVQGSLSNALPDDDEDEEEEEESELGSDDDDDDDDELDIGGDDGGSQGGVSPGSGGGAAGGGGSGDTPVYNPEEYAHILPKVSAEVRDLFSLITQFQPQPIECPTKIRPFIPDFIPCIGDIDPFLKVPRPDTKPDNLGLVVLDEPSDKQTNATVVKNHLRSILRVAMGPPVVDMVPDAQNRPQVLEKWVSDVKGQRKLQTNVNYTKPMPDITALMQEWPEEFEALMNANVQLPPPNIDMDMLQYVKMVCTLVDIPTHSNLVESLHLLFSTYLDFRSNQHFQHQ